MRRLTSAWAIAVFLVAISPVAHATVHGKNGRIAFRRYLNEAQTRAAIFTIRPDGTRLRQITDPGRRVLTTEPDWSPNGRWIVYHRERKGRTRLFKIRRNGSGRKYLSGTCNGRCLGDAFPAWAPHGNRIALHRELCSVGANNLIAIYIIRADGTHARRVTHRNATCATRHRYGDEAPGVAPRGKRLAF